MIFGLAFFESFFESSNWTLYLAFLGPWPGKRRDFAWRMPQGPVALPNLWVRTTLPPLWKWPKIGLPGRKPAKVYLTTLLKGATAGLVATPRLVIWKADSASTCGVRTPAIWIFISSATGSMPSGKTCSIVALTVPSGATVASAKPASPPGAGIWAKTSSPGVKPEPVTPTLTPSLPSSTKQPLVVAADPAADAAGAATKATRATRADRTRGTFLDKVIRGGYPPETESKRLLNARPTVLERLRELRLRVATTGHHAQGFLPVLRRDRYGCQRLRRVPLVCLFGRRAFLRCQTTTVLLSTASVTTTGITTTAGDAQSTAFSPARVVIAEQCSAPRAVALNFIAVPLRR